MISKCLIFTLCNIPIYNTFSLLFSLRNIKISFMIWIIQLWQICTKKTGGGKYFHTNVCIHTHTHTHTHTHIFTFSRHTHIYTHRANIYSQKMCITSISMGKQGTQTLDSEFNAQSRWFKESIKKKNRGTTALQKSPYRWLISIMTAETERSLGLLVAHSWSDTDSDLYERELLALSCVCVYACMHFPLLSCFRVHF